MKKVLFIGIDFSKKTFDATLMHQDRLEATLHKAFDNTEAGYSEMLRWIKKQTGEPKDAWLFCGECTGLYSIMLSIYLIKKGLFMWLENPLQIRRCMGLKRGGNDKTASGDIAMYAFRYQDRATCYAIPEKNIQSLALYFSFRERLLRNRHRLEVSSGELRGVIKRDPVSRYIYERSRKEIARISREIKDMEKKMPELINESAELKKTYELVSSVKGTGLVNTVYIIIVTQNFTCFSNSRQFACYAGVAPFGDQSGTGKNVKPHVSPFADRTMKVLLTQAARCASIHDPGIRQYAERKKAEGKNSWIILNNVRNKLIHRIFAVVKSGKEYSVDYFNELQKKAV
jgi:transposase